MERFIALLSVVVLCVAALPAEAQYYPRTGGPYYGQPPQQCCTIYYPDGRVERRPGPCARWRVYNGVEHQRPGGPYYRY